jgi:hypothetical protein
LLSINTVSIGISIYKGMYMLRQFRLHRLKTAHLLFVALTFGVVPLGWANTGNLAFMAGTYTVTPNATGTIATVQVAGIQNATAKLSGSVGFELWYSSAPYSGGGISGYKVAASYLPIGNCSSSQLPANTDCTGITVYDNLTLPPAGTYYPVLVLVEYSSSCTTDGGYCVDDAIDLVNLVTGGPTVTVQSSGGGGGGGTGGSSGSNGNAQLSGSALVSAIDWTSDTVDIQVAKVTNTTTSVTSGSLEIQLWFSTSPYSGGSLTGYKVASFPLPASCTTGQAQLAAGQGCSSIDSGTISATPPPPGTYYAVLALEEYSSACTTNGGYCIDNGIQLQNQETVPTQTGSGGGSGGSGGSSGTYGNAQLTGNISFNSIDWTSNTADLQVAGITDMGNVTTGTLELEVWYTTTPYTSGTINGYKVASYRLPASCTTGQAQLSPGSSCVSLDTGTLPLTRPPAGTYYIVVAIDEYNSKACTSNGGFCLDNAIQLQSQDTVPSATPIDPVVAATGGGGGGSIDLLFLTILALSVAVHAAVRQTNARNEVGTGSYRQ